jgi:hypothetical protein
MYSKLLNTIEEANATLPRRLAMLGWAVVVLIVLATFTAGLTAQMAPSSWPFNIVGVSSLAGTAMKVTSRL